MQAMGGYYEGLVGDMKIENIDIEAGRTILRTTLYIPISLSIAFAGLYLFMRNRKTT